VTAECIRKALKSGSPAIKKKAQFAKAARSVAGKKKGKKKRRKK